MNFDPVLSTGTAVFMAAFAASMWGSWAISLKYLGDHPLDGYFLTIFIASLVFVWGVGFTLDGAALLDNLGDVWRADPGRIWWTFVGGAVYVNGIRLQLQVQQTIGLSLAQPLQSSVSILIGVAIAVFVGGVPENVSLPAVFAAVALLIAALTAGVFSGIARSRSTTIGAELEETIADLRASLGKIMLVTVLIPAYTFALSYGLKSTTQPKGMAVLPFMAVLASGAFTGALLSSGRALVVRGQLSEALRAPARIHLLGGLSALMHYGGNIIHTFATAFLSAVISWPLGLTGGLWTQMWGLVYGEFRGAGRRAFAFLLLSIFLYLAGAALVVATIYR